MDVKKGWQGWVKEKGRLQLMLLHLRDELGVKGALKKVKRQKSGPTVEEEESAIGR